MQIGSGQSPLSLALVKALATQPAAAGAATGAGGVKAPPTAPAATARPVTASGASETPNNSPDNVPKPPRGSFVNLRV